MHKLIFMAFMMIASTSFAQTFVRACGDGAGWPPFHYVDPIMGSVSGYDVDILKEIFGDEFFNVALPTWGRCLRTTQSGRRYDLALSASKNKQREKDFLISDPYYTLTGTYYYDKERYPKGLNISHIQDLKKYEICGIADYDYTEYKLAKSNIIATAPDIPSLVYMVERRRCDAFVYYKEVMRGIELTTGYLVPHTFVEEAVPNMEPMQFHFLISKNIKNASDVVTKLNAGIQQLKESGKMKKILKKYVRY